MTKREIEWGRDLAVPSHEESQGEASLSRALKSSVAARFPEWLLVLIILTLPLQVSKTLFPIQQIEFSRLLMGVAFVWLLLAGRSRGWPLPRGMTVSLGSILTLLVTSLILTRWQNGILLVLAPLYYAGFALFVAMTVRDRMAVAMVAAAMIAAGVYVAILSTGLGIADENLWRDGIFGTLGRTNATFWDPNIAARFLNVAFIVMLAAVTVVRVSKQRIGIVIATGVVLFAIAIVLTQSRFGWIAAIATLPVAVLALRPRRAVAACSGLFLVAFIAVAAVNGTAAARVGEFAAGVTHSLGGDDPIEGRGILVGSASVTYDPPREVLGHALIERLPIDGVRYYLLEAGIAMWEDNPVLGIGVGGFQPTLLGGYRDFIPRDRLAAPVSLPHTFLSQFAAEQGVVGLAVLGVLLGVLAGLVGRATRRARTAFLRSAAVTIGLAITIIFLSSQVAGGFLVEPYLWLAIGMLAAIDRMARVESMPAGPPATRSDPS